MFFICAAHGWAYTGMQMFACTISECVPYDVKFGSSNSLLQGMFVQIIAKLGNKWPCCDVCGHGHFGLRNQYNIQRAINPKHSKIWWKISKNWPRCVRHSEVVVFQKFPIIYFHNYTDFQVILKMIESDTKAERVNHLKSNVTSYPCEKGIWQRKPK